MLRLMLRSLALVGPVLVCADTGFAGTYRIDATHSSVEFSIRHIVSRTTGRFTDFSGTVVYDQNKPEQSKVEVIIQAGSINTDNEKRDNHLRSPDFLDAKSYPVMTFKSTKVEKQGEKFVVTGDFTMHGVTRRVVLPVEVLGLGTHPMRKIPVAGFSAETAIKRSDYGVNSWADVAGVLGDEVRISLNIEATGMKENPETGQEAIAR